MIHGAAESTIQANQQIGTSRRIELSRRKSNIYPYIVDVPLWGRSNTSEKGGGRKGGEGKAKNKEFPTCTRRHSKSVPNSVGYNKQNRNTDAAYKIVRKITVGIH